MCLIWDERLSYVRQRERERKGGGVTKHNLRSSEITASIFSTEKAVINVCVMTKNLHH